jgi:UDP-N-acetylmuramyl pentapeptide phosphotransferase/UDP-N-acetylglucosamine-1-phosphate transferase
MEKVWLVNIIATFLLCVLITGLLIPQILLISFRCNLFDTPDERKIHKGVVPRLGGLAFMPAIVLSIAFLCGINGLFGYKAMFVGLRANNMSVIFSLCGILVLYLVGLADDLIGVRYRAKFIVQIGCALMLIAGGLWINNFHGLLGIYAVPWWVGMPLTVLVVVFVTNAINLIDGIDGLASGLCSITMIMYGIAFIVIGNYFYAVISFATLGVLMPFYYYNVFGNAEKHKKIFMGDTGTLSIGFIISMLGLRLLCVDADTSCLQVWHTNRLIIVLAPMLIPCYDVVRVYFGRVRAKKNPFLPDRTHIHHKLLAAGMTPSVAMASIVSCSLVLSVSLILLSAVVNVNTLAVLSIIIFYIGNIWLSRVIAKRKQKNAF